MQGSLAFPRPPRVTPVTATSTSVGAALCSAPHTRPSETLPVCGGAVLGHICWSLAESGSEPVSLTQGPPSAAGWAAASTPTRLGFWGGGLPLRMRTRLGLLEHSSSEPEGKLAHLHVICIQLLKMSPDSPPL